jgi:3-oxoacyl-[acyl-carrier protein] reductase
MTEDVFAVVQEGDQEGGADPMAPEHVAPLVGYLAGPGAGRVNGQLFVVHGGMVAVIDRPRVAAKFDTAKEAFTYEELDDLLTPYYEGRDPKETFAAAEVLALKHA